MVHPAAPGPNEGSYVSVRWAVSPAQLEELQRWGRLSCRYFYRTAEGFVGELHRKTTRKRFQTAMINNLRNWGARSRETGYQQGWCRLLEAREYFQLRGTSSTWQAEAAEAARDAAREEAQSALRAERSCLDRERSAMLAEDNREHYKLRRLRGLAQEEALAKANAEAAEQHKRRLEQIAQDRKRARPA